MRMSASGWSARAIRPEMPSSLDADVAMALGGVGEEVARAASRLQHGGLARDPETRKGVVHGTHDDGRGEELAEGRPPGGVVFLGGEERPELLADGLPAVLEAAGVRVGEDGEGDGPESAEAGERVPFIGSEAAAARIRGFSACGSRR